MLEKYQMDQIQCCLNSFELTVLIETMDIAIRFGAIASKMTRYEGAVLLAVLLAMK